MSCKFSTRASLVLNVILAGTVVALVMHKSASPTPPAADPGHPEPTTRDILPVTGEPNSAKQATGSDWRQWVDQLRAAGVPNTVIARVVLADLEDRWQKRLNECQEKFSRGEVDADAFLALSQERDREQEAELRAALGDEGYKSWDRGNTLRDLNPGKIQLSAAETNALYGLKKSLQQQNSRVVS